MTTCRPAAEKMDRRGLAKRFFSTDYLDELTSRMRSEEIPEDPRPAGGRFRSRTGGQAQGDASRRRTTRTLPKKPHRRAAGDQHDLGRRGRAAAGPDGRAGQPKTTAEYIQATSRVGRSMPGLVCTVFNWARPRDLSHYETFEHYHATFYQHVEALSVTPFSPGALQRGLAACWCRWSGCRAWSSTPTRRPSRIQTTNPYVQEAIEAIAKRAAADRRRPRGRRLRAGPNCRARSTSGRPRPRTPPAAGR